jgi:hypothetical protein
MKPLKLIANAMLIAVFSIGMIFNMVPAHGQITFHFSDGPFQQYIVPPGVTKLEIEVVGADGGGRLESRFSNTFLNGGKGATAIGTFAVSPGDVLELRIGAAGANEISGIGENGTAMVSTAPGGGDASAVYFMGNPLIIAGGGGGSGGTAAGFGGTASTTGGTSGPGDNSPNPGGSNGNGGLGGRWISFSSVVLGNGDGFGGGGGGGYLSAGATGQGNFNIVDLPSAGPGIGGAILKGGTGGTGVDAGYGGGGGGGGYSGGSGSDGGGNGSIPTSILNFVNGGGGGSFVSNAATNVSISAGAQGGGIGSNGRVVINLNPTSPPVALCKNITVPANNNCQGIAGALDFNDGSYDPDPGSVLAFTVWPESPYPLGTTTVTLTVNSTIGGSSTCIATIEVIDDEPPMITCRNVVLYLDENGFAEVNTDTLATATDNCSVAVLESIGYQSFNCESIVFSPTGYVAPAVAFDPSGNSSTCNNSILILDTIPPTASCQNVVVQLDNMGNGSTTALAVDNGSTDVCGIETYTLSRTAFTCADVGDVAVVLTVTDVNNNSSTCDATVTVQDITPPTLACLTNTIFLDPTGNYTLLDTDVLDFDASTDNCSDITVTSISPSSFDCDDLMQTFDVLVTAQDDSGNSSQCIASITVFEGTALPQPWAGLGIGGQGTGSTYEYSPCSLPPVYTIETGAANNSQTGDNLATIAQTLCGDFSIEVKIEAVTSNGWVGLTARESAASGSKMIGMYSNLGSIVRWESRQFNNAPKSINLFQRPFPYWLRLVRQGNLFIGYYSVNGSSYSIVNIQNIPLGSCLEAGIAAFTSLPGQTATAVFSNLAASGGAIPLSIAPGSTVEPAQAERTAHLWPNPAREAFTLEIPAASAETRLRLLNQLGQPLEERLLPAGESQLEWGISQLPAGLYFVEVFPAAGQSKTVLRFVKTD